MIGTIKKNLTLYGEKCIKVEGGKITLVKTVRNESLYPLCRDTIITELNSGKQLLWRCRVKRQRKNFNCKDPETEVSCGNLKQGHFGKNKNSSCQG